MGLSALRQAGRRALLLRIQPLGGPGCQGNQQSDGCIPMARFPRPWIPQPNPGLIKSRGDSWRDPGGEHLRLRLAVTLDPIRGELWRREGVWAGLYRWGSVARIPHSPRSLLPLHTREAGNPGYLLLSLRFSAGGTSWTLPCLLQTSGALQGGREKNSLEFEELQKVSASWLGLEAMLQVEAPWGAGFATGESQSVSKTRRGQPDSPWGHLEPLCCPVRSLPERKASSGNQSY